MSVDEHEIRIVITRLARPHASGGYVIERAAILAEGADFPALNAWILAHGGTPAMRAAPATSSGLHGVGRMQEAAVRSGDAPQYLLPASALA